MMAPSKCYRLTRVYENSGAKFETHVRTQTLITRNSILREILYIVKPGEDELLTWSNILQTYQQRLAPSQSSALLACVPTDKTLRFPFENHTHFQCNTIKYVIFQTSLLFIQTAIFISEFKTIFTTFASVIPQNSCLSSAYNDRYAGTPAATVPCVDRTFSISTHCQCSVLQINGKQHDLLSDMPYTLSFALKKMLVFVYVCIYVCVSVFSTLTCIWSSVHFSWI